MQFAYDAKHYLVPMILHGCMDYEKNMSSMKKIEVLYVCEAQELGIVNFIARGSILSR